MVSWLIVTLTMAVFDLYNEIVNIIHEPVTYPGV